MTRRVEIPVEVVQTALARVARTARWPDGSLLLDIDVAVLDVHVAPALAVQLRALSTESA